MRTPQRQQELGITGEAPQVVQPVFLDHSGRRRRLTVMIGFGVAAVLLASLALIGVGLFSDAPVSIPGWSGGDSGRDERPATLIEKMGASPSAPGRDDLVSVTIPTRVPTRSTAPAPPRPGPSVSPLPGGTTTHPGQGDEHRNTPSGKPDRSPGKPS